MIQLPPPDKFRNWQIIHYKELLRMHSERGNEAAVRFIKSELKRL